MKFEKSIHTGDVRVLIGNEYYGYVSYNNKLDEWTFFPEDDKEFTAIDLVVLGHEMEKHGRLWFR